MGVSLDTTAKDTGSRGTRREVKSQSRHSLAPRPRASHVLFRSLRFLIYKVGTMITPYSQGWSEIKHGKCPTDPGTPSSGVSCRKREAL